MILFFNQLLQNSLTAVILILAILLFRKLTGDLSKLYVHILWIITMLVLVLPPIPSGSLQTARGLLPKTEFGASGKQSGAAQEAETGILAGAEIQNISAEMPKNSESGTLGAAPEERLYRGEGSQAPSGLFNLSIAEIFFALWGLGAITLAIITLTEWLRLKKKVKSAVRIRRDVWSTAQISTPFVMPGLPSRIYIPQGLDKEADQLEDILKHERRHIRNRDPWIKCFTALVLLLHWFNPFVWLAYRLMNRDMEMYCDECVLRGKGIEEKKHYAQTLLNYACKSSGFSPAVYFGESNTKKRIWHILNTKRPRAAVSLFLLLMISGCGMSFLAAGETEPEKAVVDMTKDVLLTETLSDTDAADGNGNHAESGEEEKHWSEKRIVSSDRKDVESGLDKNEMNIMGETEHFTLYGIREGEEMAVQTPDGLVYAEVPLISNYEVEPQIMEQDFDGDGREELAVITYVLHGTGMSIRSLFMADKDTAGTWNIYHLPEEDYIQELTSHFTTQYTEEGVKLIFNGAPAGAAEQVEQEQLDNEYAYYAGSQINFRFTEEKIYLRADLVGYSNINQAGSYTGHQLEANLYYLGEGKWQFLTVNYADAGITELIEYAVPQYIAGNTSEVNGHYTAPGTQLSDFGEPQEITILSIIYPPEELAGGETEAYVTIRRAGEDALDYLHVPLKRVQTENEESGWGIADRFGWRIAGEIYMER